MEPSSDETLTEGSSEKQAESSHIVGSGEGHPHFATAGSPHRSYFETAGAQNSSLERSPAHSIPTIAEGANVPVHVASLALATKSPSPQHSSASTTTTTTPTSQGSGCEGGGKGPGPEFPHDLSTQTIAHQVHHPGRDTDIPQTGDAGWATALGAVPEGGPYHTSGSVSAPAISAQPEQQARYNPAHYPASIKLLVSNNVAGSIIGRAGQTISELQRQSSTRIKLSQSGDYYPGTQDRVCLVQGETEDCRTALRLLLDRLHALQEHQHSQHMAWQLQRQKGAAPSFDFVVRLLVPVSSCGMIIGKSGSNIKFMEETTGVSSVRLSPKAGGDGPYSIPAIFPPTTERIVTITGPNVQSCLQCIYVILQGMVAHPDIGRYTNMTTSYSRLIPDTYHGANRPILVPVPPPTTRLRVQEHHSWETMPMSNPFAPSSQGLSRRFASSPDLPGVALNPRLPGLPLEPPTPERLVGYDAGLVPPSSSPFSPLQIPRGSVPSGGPLYLIPQPHGPDINDARHVAHSVSAPDLLAFQLEQSLHLSSPPAPPIQEYPHAFMPQPPTMSAPDCFNAQVLIPDSMIGSILGRGGSTLTELEMLSGTRIRASQRGEFMPGTRSRIVTVRGPTAQSVMQAQFMMSQRMVLPPTATYAAHQGVSGDQHSSNIPSGDSKSNNTDSSAKPDPS